MEINENGEQMQVCSLRAGMPAKWMARREEKLRGREKIRSLKGLETEDRIIL